MNIRSLERAAFRSLYLCTLLMTSVGGQNCTPSSTQNILILNGCTFPEGANLDTNYKASQFNISWPDNYTDTRNNNGSGSCINATTCTSSLQRTDCYALFDSPVGSSNGSWSETVHNATWVGTSGTNQDGQSCFNYSCGVTGVVSTATDSHTCPAPVCSGSLQCPNSFPICGADGQYRCANGEPGCAGSQPGACCSNCYVLCQPGGWTCFGSPIVLDVYGKGFHFTDVTHGVQFRVLPDQPQHQMSWPDAAFRNGWLVLDRNGDGKITDFTELFGNATPQPPTEHPNGYLVLAVFDLRSNGGNGNGLIDPGDAIYDHLRLWIDENHNGISEPTELHTLHEAGIFRIDLNYSVST